MRAIKSCGIHLSLLMVAIAAVSPAQAASYTITLIDYPGATDTQVLGVNRQGQAVGTAFDAAGNWLSAFIYDTAKSQFTFLGLVPGSLATALTGINDRGAIVGGFGASAALGPPEIGFIRNKVGPTFTVFSQWGWDNTEARGINNNGVVTGWSFATAAQSSVGFIYDAEHDYYVEFLPSRSTIAQGINTRGQVVGSSLLNAGEAYPASPAGQYAWLRASSGSVTKFRVNGLDSVARGINESGAIVGAVGPAGARKGFVTSFASVRDDNSLPEGYTAITIADGDLLAVPGQTDTIPEDINDTGVIVGIVVDAATTHQHGFVAVPKRH
jgi:uncharacterized membrane protein